MAEPSINLRQLSELLGLSQTTVSRALNGYPEVNAATRARVLAAADAHDYRPNVRARGLATGRTMAVASIVPQDATHEMVNPVYADFIRGAAEVLTEAQFDLMLTTVPDVDAAVLYHRIARRGGVDGLIIHAPRSGDGRLEILHETRMPFVVHGRFAEDEASYCWVDTDNAAAFATATRHLLDLGHRRIGLVNGLADMVFARQRQAGYARALAEHGLTVQAELIRNGTMTEEHGFASTASLLAGTDPPTAILASSWIVALGVERACLGRDLTPGRDIALIAHDDQLSYFQSAAPRFATVTSPVRDHGRQAAAMLLDLIDDPTGQPRRHLAQATFHTGPSLCPPP